MTRPPLKSATNLLTSPWLLTDAGGPDIAAVCLLADAPAAAALLSDAAAAAAPLLSDRPATMLLLGDGAGR